MSIRIPYDTMKETIRRALENAGLALDMAAALMAAGKCGTDMDDGAYGACGGCSQVFFAYDPAVFGGEEELEAMLDRRVDAAHAAAPAEEGGEVLYPGEGSARRLRENRSSACPPTSASGNRCAPSQAATSPWRRSPACAAERKHDAKSPRADSARGFSASVSALSRRIRTLRAARRGAARRSRPRASRGCGASSGRGTARWPRRRAATVHTARARR